MTLIEAIAHIEGFYAVVNGKVPNRPQRNNNPGDLDFEPWMVEKYNAVLEGGVPHPRFARFPDAETGFRALSDLLAGQHYCELTIESAVNRYAPPIENDTNGYVGYVCKEVGCLPTDKVSQWI